MQLVGTGMPKQENPPSVPQTSPIAPPSETSGPQAISDLETTQVASPPGGIAGATLAGHAHAGNAAVEVNAMEDVELVLLVPGVVSDAPPQPTATHAARKTKRRILSAYHEYIEGRYPC
jgi:hypothetical protein